jgi:hypothetical protein
MPFEDSKTTRRKVVGGVATGVAAAIAAPAFGQQGPQPQNVSNIVEKPELKNPSRNTRTRPSKSSTRTGPALPAK